MAEKAKTTPQGGLFRPAPPGTDLKRCLCRHLLLEDEAVSQIFAQVHSKPVLALELCQTDIENITFGGDDPSFASAAVVAPGKNCQIRTKMDPVYTKSYIVKENSFASIGFHHRQTITAFADIFFNYHVLNLSYEGGLS